jgi:hypothetical protein
MPQVSGKSPSLAQHRPDVTLPPEATQLAAGPPSPVGASGPESPLLDPELLPELLPPLLEPELLAEPELLPLLEVEPPLEDDAASLPPASLPPLPPLVEPPHAAERATARRGTGRRVQVSFTGPRVIHPRAPRRRAAPRIRWSRRGTNR